MNIYSLFLHFGSSETQQVFVEQPQEFMQIILWLSSIEGKTLAIRFVRQFYRIVTITIIFTLTIFTLARHLPTCELIQLTKLVPQALPNVRNITFLYYCYCYCYYYILFYLLSYSNLSHQVVGHTHHLPAILTIASWVD